MKKIVLTAAFISVWALYLQAQTSPKSNLKLSMANGRKVYETYCLACHQVDGSGVPQLNPPLINTSFVKGDKLKLIGIVLNGLKDTEIDGEVYSNPMPSFSATLKDQEIADVLTYIRNSFGNKAGAVTASQVKAIRLKTK